MDEFDVVVVGGGLAGLTAAIFAADCGRSTTVLMGGGFGGQLLNIGRIDGLPGFPQGVPGFELCPALQEQAAEAGAHFGAAQLRALEPADGGWCLSTGDGNVRARAVIVATGCRFQQLGVPGETALTGKGVSTCASCDGPLVRGRIAGVVGGGDSALQEALELADHVEQVILFVRGDSLRAKLRYRRRVLEHPTIDVRYQTVVEKILGEDVVSGVTFRNVATGEVDEVELAAVFAFVGLDPHTDFIGDPALLDDSGRIVTDRTLRTRLPGVFAAGTVRSDAEAQAATAAGEGAAAALAAHRYLTDGGWPKALHPNVPLARSVAG